jgi:hypothetical protein
VFRESAMQMFVYVVLAAIIYAVLADRTDKAVDREMKKRRAEASTLALVEDFDVRPQLGPRFGRTLIRHVMRR